MLILEDSREIQERFKREIQDREREREREREILRILQSAPVHPILHEQSFGPMHWPLTHEVHEMDEQEGSPSHPVSHVQ